MNHRIALVAITILVGVLLAYWPVLQGGFVWDDLTSFVWNDWLTQGDQWKTYLFRGFNFWEHYFRPLVVGLFTLQLRLFDSDPGAMHAVSLLLHLLNTSLVGWLALRIADIAGRTEASKLGFMAAAMVLFGFHPAMIETVAWIGCQFDLVMTTFALLALLANATLSHPIARPLLVASCFFLAACAKEAAVAIPLLLVIFDWALQARQGGQAQGPNLGEFVRRNAGTWLAVVLAGIIYLAFRHWALGNAMPPADVSISWFARVQLVAFTYLRYWGLVFVPSIGMAPIHPYPIEPFLLATAGSLATVALALGLVAWAIITAYRRGSGLACLVLAVTAALLPVLRVLPTGFDPNLFHYRYLTCALAVLCALLPLLRAPPMLRRFRSPRAAVTVLAVAWMFSSVVAIRATLPLWANQVSLWYWALERHPDSALAATQLLGGLLDAERWSEARELADRILIAQPDCTNCLINSALLALIEGDVDRAQREYDLLIERKAEYADSSYMSGKVDRLRDGLKRARR